MEIGLRRRAPVQRLRAGPVAGEFRQARFEPGPARLPALRGALASLDAEIAAGGARVKKVIEIGDRGEAIDKAIASASPATTVLIAGKGHETGQSAGGVVTIPSCPGRRGRAVRRVPCPDRRVA